MQSIKELLYHTKTEKRSLFILIFIIAAMTLVKRYLVSHYQPKAEDFSYLENFLLPYNNMVAYNDSTLVSSKYEVEQVKSSAKSNDLTTENKNAGTFSIDPNTAPSDSLRLLGLSPFAVSNLIKYRDKGGQIKAPQQLTRIYGIDSNTYTKVKEQIEIKHVKNSYSKPSTTIKKSMAASPNSKNLKNQQPEKKNVFIDINKADEVQLQYVRGIGPSFAKRIVKYRELIGGYHSKNQLMEVYGIDQKKYMEIKDQVTVSGNVKQLNINSKDIKSISRHPYISYQEAKLIAAYTKKHGPISNAYDIVKIGVMDSLFVEKIIPYLPDSIIYRNAQTPPTSL